MFGVVLPIGSDKRVAASKGTLGLGDKSSHHRANTWNMISMTYSGAKVSKILILLSKQWTQGFFYSKVFHLVMAIGYNQILDDNRPPTAK